MLYKYISDKYNSIPSFANISGISQQELSAVLLKENVTKDISSVIKICLFLNLDIQRLISTGEVAEACDNASRDVLISEFRERYMRLSVTEKKKVFEFMNSM
jgi:hypothetical protein